MATALKRGSKRAHKTLTIDEKIEILDQLGTKSYTLLAEQYGIGRSTICDIKRKEAELRQYKTSMKEMGMSRSAKVMKCGKDVELEKALFLWFKQKREEGMPISGPVLKAKAIDLHKQLQQLRSEDTSTVEVRYEFNASQGWFSRFCQRHNLRQLSFQGEKLSADVPAADGFIPEFQKVIAEGHYSLEQIFNCDESGLYYKLLPSKTMAAHFEKSVAGRKTQKERITINACSNVTGTIKLPLQVIGKAKNPRCFKNVDVSALPVIYNNQTNAWMDCALFSNWFHNHFVPFVQEALKEKNLTPKAILLLDNCSAHPDEDELISADGQVIATFLPPNVTALIQPMDQGVLSSIKRRYRRKILEELVLQDTDGKSVKDFLKSIHILRVIHLIATCWDEITATTLRRSWRKIIPIEDVDSRSVDEPPSSDDTPSNTELCEAFQMIVPEGDESDISDWLHTDENDQGYAHLTDQEIVESVLDSAAQESEDSDSDDDVFEVPGPCPVSHAEAVASLEKSLVWLQDQVECNTYNLSLLQSLREIAARKRFNGLRQSVITDHFTQCTV